MEKAELLVLKIANQQERRELRKQEERLKGLQDTMAEWMLETLIDISPIGDKKMLKLKLYAEVRTRWPAWKCL